MYQTDEKMQEFNENKSNLSHLNSFNSANRRVFNSNPRTPFSEVNSNSVNPNLMRSVLFTPNDSSLNLSVNSTPFTPVNRYSSNVSLHSNSSFAMSASSSISQQEKKSRWAKFNESLLHENSQEFLKKSLYEKKECSAKKLSAKNSPVRNMFRVIAGKDENALNTADNQRMLIKFYNSEKVYKHVAENLCQSLNNLLKQRRDFMKVLQVPFIESIEFDAKSVHNQLELFVMMLEVLCLKVRINELNYLVGTQKGIELFTESEDSNLTDYVERLRRVYVFSSPYKKQTFSTFKSVSGELQRALDGISFRLWVFNILS